MENGPAMLCAALRLQRVCAVYSVSLLVPTRQDSKEMHFAPGIMGPNRAPFSSPLHPLLLWSVIGQSHCPLHTAVLCCWKHLAGPQRTFVHARPWVHNAILPPCHTLLGFHGRVRSTPPTAVLPPASHGSAAEWRGQRRVWHCFLGNEFCKLQCDEQHMIDLWVPELCPQFLLHRTFAAAKPPE